MSFYIVPCTVVKCVFVVLLAVVQVWVALPVCSLLVYELLLLNTVLLHFSFLSFCGRFGFIFSLDQFSSAKKLGVRFLEFIYRSILNMLKQHIILTNITC